MRLMLLYTHFATDIPKITMIRTADTLDGKLMLWTLD